MIFIAKQRDTDTNEDLVRGGYKVGTDLNVICGEYKMNTKDVSSEVTCLNSYIFQGMRRCLYSYSNLRFNACR
jgi:hypothetical protein